MKQKIYLFLIALGLVFSYPTYSQVVSENSFGAQIEAGFGMKIKSENSNAYQLFISPHYRIYDSFSTGIGVGLMAHGDIEPKYSIPVYAHATYKMNNSANINPFLNLKIGYGIGSGNSSYLSVGTDKNNTYSVQTKHNGAFFISPAVGIKYKVAEKSSISLAVSYDLYKIKNKSTVNSTGSPEIRIPKYPGDNSTVAVRIGYEF